MSNLLFDDVRQWRICLWSGVCKAAWGVYRILTCILFGIASVFVWIGKQIGAFCKREFVAAFVVGLMWLMGLMGWVFTFVHERTLRVSAEHERDSVAYVLQQKLEIYEPFNETVLMSGDTIKTW